MLIGNWKAQIEKGNTARERKAILIIPDEDADYDAGCCAQRQRTERESERVVKVVEAIGRII